MHTSRRTGAGRYDGDYQYVGDLEGSTAYVFNGMAKGSEFDDRARRRRLSAGLSKLLWTTLATQILSLLFLYDHAPLESPVRFDWKVMIAAALQVPQVLGIIFGTAKLLRNIDTVSVGDSWNLYMATSLGFSGVYFLIFLFAADSFVANDPRVLDSGPDTLLISLTYYSVSVQTLTSPGDISPSGMLPEYVTVLQMLIGMLYSVFIISHTQELFDHDSLHSVQSTLRKQDRGCCARCWARLKDNTLVRNVRLFMRRYLIIVSLVIWTTNLLMLHVLEPDVDRNFEYRLGVILVECIFQALQIGTVVLTSAKFVRHVDEITLSFLAQTFVAMCLTFCGLYNLFYVFSRHGDRSFSLVRYDVGRTPTYVVVSQLFYFSVAMMTTAGIGDVYPRRWFTQLLAASQMLLSVLFTIVVLGRGVSRLNERRRIEKSRLEMYAGAGVSVPLSGT
eukprot:g689.t1